MDTTSGSLIDELNRYTEARRLFLRALGVPGSNRDPLAEFAERLAAVVLGGTLATSRTQRGWDLELPDKSKVQVRYLANSGADWVNEHDVEFAPGVSKYALLVLEALSARMLVVFSASSLAGLSRRLKKRHPGQDRKLRLTRRNLDQLLRDKEAVAHLGITIIELGET